ncbi:MAG: sulfatase [Cyclobacteriaceae bacterium]|nr:sulfatase [Cyclobacteriaceae bacterium]
MIPNHLISKDPGRLNVLFICIDDINNWVGYLGENHQARTPNIDQLAESSMVFLNAYCAAPVCGPSRTSLLYGIYPHKTGSYGHHEVYDPGNISKLANRETLPALFKREGYYTAGAGKIFHYESDGFQTYYDAKNDPEPNPEHPDTYSSSSFKFGPVKPEQEKEIIDFRITEWAIEQLKQDFDVPFFISVGYKKPHLPWIAKESNFDTFNLDSIKLPPFYANDLDDIPNSGKVFARTIFGFNKLEKESDHEFITRQPELWERLVRAYMASIHHTDEMIGKLMEALNSSQYKDNTIIVLWGDHGWHLGEKEHWRKMTLWRKGTRTPLIIYAPSVTIEGSRYAYPVSLQDIYPTLVDLCGLNTEQELDGMSLLPVLGNPQTRQDRAVLISHGPGNFAICLDRWRYIQYYNGEEELYNIETDPHEFYNLAGKADYKNSLSEFRKLVPENYEMLLCPRFKSFYDDFD